MQWCASTVTTSAAWSPALNGPEAGVWVIAETTDLPTKFAKIVVTDDQGRYLIPDLPKANYNIWVRGYGLVDSPKVRTAPGKTLNLKAVIASTDAAAAEYYPAIYWYSMLKIPDKSEFPGTGEKGNGMPEKLKHQAQWLDVVKTNGCNTCHQLGNKATRTIAKQLGEFKSSSEAWQRRILSGQAMTSMLSAVDRIDSNRAMALFGDWTDRIAAGEVPKSKPPRPAGCRAQRRHQRVGLEQSQGLSARRDFHRQAQSDGQRQRADLRLDGIEHGFRAGARPGTSQSLRR